MDAKQEIAKKIQGLIAEGQTEDAIEALVAFGEPGKGTHLTIQ